MHPADGACHRPRFVCSLGRVFWGSDATLFSRPDRYDQWTDAASSATRAARGGQPRHISRLPAVAATRRSRVRKRHCCRSLPSEPDGIVSCHPAQAAAKPGPKAKPVHSTIQSCLFAMNAHPFEERTVFKVGTPARVKWIGVHLDLDVPPNRDAGWIDQFQPDDFPVRRPFAGVRRKHLEAVQPVPVFPDNPAGRFAGVSASRPTPETLPYNSFHFSERPFCHDVPVIVCPASNHWIKPANHLRLGHAQP